MTEDLRARLNELADGWEERAERFRVGDDVSNANNLDGCAEALRAALSTQEQGEEGVRARLEKLADEMASYTDDRDPVHPPIVDEWVEILRTALLEDESYSEVGRATKYAEGFAERVLLSISEMDGNEISQVEHDAYERLVEIDRERFGGLYVLEGAAIAHHVANRLDDAFFDGEVRLATDPPRDEPDGEAEKNALMYGIPVYESDGEGRVPEGRVPVPLMEAEDLMREIRKAVIFDPADGEDGNRHLRRISRLIAKTQIGRTPPTEDREAERAALSKAAEKILAIPVERGRDQNDFLAALHAAAGAVIRSYGDGEVAPTEDREARRPIGYVEEAELPIRGRATLHETPDASRRAVYVETDAE